MGLENVDPSHPAMFVGNHTLFGLQDVPHILVELQRVHGIFPRSLGDHRHFEVPLWRDFLIAFGCVEGTRENCTALMRAGQHLMVFPGGGREVFKRKNEAYQLIWKERIGFVQMAASFGYPIVPFASLGADESLHIVEDADAIMNSPIGNLLRAFGADKYLKGGEELMNSPIGNLLRAFGADKYLKGGEELPPLVSGLGLTPIPEPVRFFFSFGRPIPTTPYRHRVEDTAAMHELRAEVAASIEAQLEQLQRVRRNMSGEGADASRGSERTDA